MIFNKVLVTGGSGLIGSHLVEELTQLSNQIVVLDDFSTGNSENLSSISLDSNLKIVRGSVLDRVLLDQHSKDIDLCVHLAASLGVNRILDKTLLSYEANVHGTENVVRAASEVGARLFFASTSEIYGKNPVQPLREDSDRVLGSPLNVRWSYSEAKALDESLVQIYKQEQGLNFVIGRFFNTVGPRQTGSYGMVLPRFVKAALDGEDLRVYGDGSQTRVFCHVKDAVRAVVGLVTDVKHDGEVFNIGGEGEISIASLAEKVITLSGSKSQIKFVPYSEAYPSGFEETFRRVPDTTKLRRAINWQPQYSLDNIIIDVIQYFSTKH